MNGSEKPNILVIITDQQRRDHLGCYGNAVVQTPNLDRLAAEGVRFARHYVNNPLCMPGRATLFTGLTPRAHTVRTNGINLPRHLPVLPGILKDAGYQTKLVGKLHIESFNSNVPGERIEARTYEEMKAGREVWGFESGELVHGHGTGVKGAYADWLPAKLGGAESPWKRRITGRDDIGLGEQCICTEITEELHHSTWIAERTCEFLRRRDPERPFFVWCSFPDPHHPYTPPQDYADRYPAAKVALPTRREGELVDLPPHFREAFEGRQRFSGRGASPARQTDAQMREIIGRTYGMVSLIDVNVGRVLETLRELGLERDTLVVFTSDHGDMMGDHWLLNKGPFHFDGLLTVPFIVRWPAGYASGRTVSSLTSHLDFVPTLLDAAGLKYPEGAVPDPPECERQRPPLVGASLAPLLTSAADAIHDAVLVENDEDYIGSNLRTVVTDRYKLTCYSGREYGELFDLERDPGELHNLWADPASAGVKRELKVRLLALLMDTESPLPRRISHA